MNKIISLFRRISWKKLGIGLLIIYALGWSYLFLSLKYVEHMQAGLNATISQCRSFNDSQQKCVDTFKEHQSSLYWLFKPVIGR